MYNLYRQNLRNNMFGGADGQEKLLKFSKKKIFGLPLPMASLIGTDAALVAAAVATGDPYLYAAGAVTAASIMYIYNHILAMRTHDFKEHQQLKKKIMELHPGYIYELGCEDEATEGKIGEKWNTKFGSTLWTDLYKEEPIIVINGHGGLINPKLDLYQKRFIKVPEKTQLISFTRSGSEGFPGTYRVNDKLLDYSELDDDIKNTAMNPNNEKFYFLENDGIKRKSPYIYRAYINEEKRSFGVNCQKLYREDDIVNNISIDFYDHNNAFKGDTGIYIYNSKIPVEEYLSHFRNLKQQYLQYLQSHSSELINADLPTDIHNILFNDQMNGTPHDDWDYSAMLALADAMAMDNIKLLDLLLNTDVEKLSSSSSRFNFKFLPGGLISLLGTTLYNIMSVIQDGTYYINSCKSGDSKTNEEIELARELSRRGDYPPVLASQLADDGRPASSGPSIPVSVI